jgi:hypothetical protein
MKTKTEFYELMRFVLFMTVFTILFVFLPLAYLISSSRSLECEKHVEEKGTVVRVDFAFYRGNEKYWYVLTDTGYYFEDKEPWNIGMTVQKTTEKCKKKNKEQL